MYFTLLAGHVREHAAGALLTYIVRRYALARTVATAMSTREECRVPSAADVFGATAAALAALLMQAFGHRAWRNVRALVLTATCRS